MSTPEPMPAPKAQKPILTKTASAIVIIIGLLAIVGVSINLLTRKEEVNQTTFFFLLVIFGLATAIIIFGITEVIADVSGNLLGFKIRAGGPFGALVIVMLLGLYYDMKIHESLGQKVLFYDKNLSDNPIKSQPYAVAIIPSNNLKAVVETIDENGRADFALSSGYYSDSVRFKLLVNGFELKEPSKYYKLERDKNLNVEIRHKKVRFSFYISNAETRVPLRGIEMRSDELGLDTVSNVNGVIEHWADTSLHKNFRFNFPTTEYSFGKDNLYLMNQTVASFPLYPVKKK